ncbi:hypothetical protein THRCLA_23152 [Thraustotheca clavata]|uniref:Uncharacterized protein n=1 Tax=Thraustotheca clavata TaxID=74557 RepID=A0A1V9YCH6_9STRA|nr:hypothetical protein THRCLA_23152 [Thraustotheca clavata]
MSESSVTGLTWHDAQGLLLAVEGDLASSGHKGLGALATLVDRSAALDGSAKAVVRIETSKRAVLVQQQCDSSVLAVSTTKTDDQ